MNTTEKSIPIPTYSSLRNGDWTMLTEHELPWTLYKFQDGQWMPVQQITSLEEVDHWLESVRWMKDVGQYSYWRDKSLKKLLPIEHLVPSIVSFQSVVQQTDETPDQIIEALEQWHRDHPDEHPF